MTVAVPSLPLAAGQARVYTPKEVQAVLKAGKPHVYALLNSGELRAVRIGRQWRIPHESVEEFLSGGK